VDSRYSICSLDCSDRVSFASAEAKMKLFPVNEWELRTRKSKDEVVSRLGKRATFVSNRFYIYTEPSPFNVNFPISRSYVEGELVEVDGFTVLYFKVYPTALFKSFLIIFLSFFFIFFGLSVVSYMSGKASFSILLILLLFMSMAFFFSQLQFHSSVEMQKMSISQLVKGTD
jgi:hypothetical protein